MFELLRGLPLAFMVGLRGTRELQFMTRKNGEPEGSAGPATASTGDPPGSTEDGRIVTDVVAAPATEAAAAPAQAGSVVGPVELTTAHPSKQWAASRKEAFCTNIGVGVTFLGIGCLLLLMTETAIAHIAGLLSFCIAAYAALLILLQGNRAPDWEEAWRKFYYFLDWFREVLRKK